MKQGLRHFFSIKLVLVCLAMLLGVHGAAQTAPRSKMTTKVRPSRHRVKKQASKTKKETPPHKAPIPPDTQADPPTPLKKPKVLEPTSTTTKDPWMRLDTLIVKRPIIQAPYVLWVQTIGVAIDYGRLAMRAFIPQECRYAGILSILFRKNIQLSGAWGYQKLSQKCVLGNQSDCTVVGHYGKIGLDNFVFYNFRNNLYAGLRYARSYFKIHTTPASSDEQVITKALKASWWELVIGSEHQIFDNLGLYVGLMVHLKGLGHFEPFASATNYVVPGYGRNVQNTAPAITLYIKYQISFLAKKITFD